MKNLFWFKTKEQAIEFKEKKEKGNRYSRLEYEYLKNPLYQINDEGKEIELHHRIIGTMKD